jgi:hypothetical protein
MSALDVTQADLLRVLREVASRPAVDRAVRARANEVAAAIEGEGRGASARVVRRGVSDYSVVVSAPNLLAREFGDAGGAPDPVIGPAIQRLASREG